MGEFYDEVILHCSSDGCPSKGKDVFVDFRVSDSQLIFYVHGHGNPVCEHAWKQAKDDIDHEIEEYHEEAQLKWCPQCIQRIPKSSTMCPECGASLA